MNKYIKYIFLISILAFNFNLFSQTPNKYGIRAGVVFNGIQSIGNQNSIFQYTDAFYNSFSYDIGAYKEWTFSKEFCVSTELHYIQKGETNENLKLTFITATEPWIVVQNWSLPDRFNYISAQILPRFMFAHTNAMLHSSDVWFMYVFGGPTFNMLVSNSNSKVSDKIIPVKNGRVEIGAMIGFGSELLDFLTFEFRAEHVFNGPYSVVFPDYTVTRVHNSVYFLVGFAINKFFEKEKKVKSH